jgi:hypothetical protein
MAILDLLRSVEHAVPRAQNDSPDVELDLLVLQVIVDGFPLAG